MTERRGDTHDTGGIKQALLNQSILDTCFVTFPVAAVAVTYGSPCPTDTCTTAAEQEVVVQLVFLYRGSAADEWGGRALDSEHHRAVVLRREYVSPEAVIIGFPSDRHTLHFKSTTTTTKNYREHASAWEAGGGGDAPRSSCPSSCTTRAYEARNTYCLSSWRVEGGSHDA